MDWAMISLVLMLPVTLWATALPDTTYPQVCRLLLGIFLFYSLINWANSQRRVHLVGLGLFGLAFALGCFAFISVPWRNRQFFDIPSAIYEPFQVLVSDWVHPNVMALALVVLFPVLLSIFLFVGGKLKRWQMFANGLIVVFTAIMIVLTQARGSLVTLFALILILVALRWRRGWLLVTLGLIIVMLLSVCIGPRKILEIVIATDALTGLDGRMEIWSRAIYMIQDFPFTGIGMGSFGPVADSLYPFFLRAPGTIPHSHNIFLQIAVDLGIPGLIAWLAIFLLIAWMGWQLFRYGRSANDPWAMAMGAGMLGVQAALMLNGMVESAIWGMVRSAPLLWGIWGLGAAAWQVLLPASAKS